MPVTEQKELSKNQALTTREKEIFDFIRKKSGMKAFRLRFVKFAGESTFTPHLQFMVIFPDWKKWESFAEILPAPAPLKSSMILNGVIKE